MIRNSLLFFFLSGMFSFAYASNTSSVQSLEVGMYFALIIAIVIYFGVTPFGNKRKKNNEMDLSKNHDLFNLGTENKTQPKSSFNTGFDIDLIDDVDPVAEAEVYIAYGRDAQAEEILNEALAKEKFAPRKNEILLKLLEVYRSRKDTKRFNQMLSELKENTDGNGPEYEAALKLANTSGFQPETQNPKPTEEGYCQYAKASPKANEKKNLASALLLLHMLSTFKNLSDKDMFDGVTIKQDFIDDEAQTTKYTIEIATR